MDDVADPNNTHFACKIDGIDASVGGRLAPEDLIDQPDHSPTQPHTPLLCPITMQTGFFPSSPVAARSRRPQHNTHCCCAPAVLDVCPNPPHVSTPSITTMAPPPRTPAAAAAAAGAGRKPRRPTAAVSAASVAAAALALAATGGTRTQAFVVALPSAATTRAPSSSSSSSPLLSSLGRVRGGGGSSDSSPSRLFFKKQSGGTTSRGGSDATLEEKRQAPATAIKSKQQQPSQPPQPLVSFQPPLPFSWGAVTGGPRPAPPAVPTTEEGPGVVETSAVEDSEPLTLTSAITLVAGTTVGAGILALPGMYGRWCDASSGREGLYTYATTIA